MEKRREIVLKSIHFLLNRTTLIVIALAATLVVVLGGTFEVTSAAQPNAELEIQKLTVCHALGIDAIGGGNLQEGKNILRDCSTQDAEFTNNLAGGITKKQTGTDALADYIYSVYQANGYQATQHLIGSINVSVRNTNEAIMSSYVHGTHKRSETSIDVANGTYEDEVVKVSGHWKIRRRTFNQINFLNLRSPTDSTRLNLQ
ncbi:MAG: nuclear transport factor 2 family protein [Brasilonema octagenarum HA4186-MV1]|nr:nuclear transport factor 2 family protein [Brasilonema octagenarum HA4186-MV1]